MRILLAQNSLYYPSHGGGDKSNRLLMEALAARGHVCQVVARIGAFGEGEHEHYLSELRLRGVRARSASGGVVVFERLGVEIDVVTSANLRAHFANRVKTFRPEAILTSTDDPAQLLLEAALRAESARVFYLARATLAVPFGPDCAFPSEVKTERIRAVERVVGVSQYVADYFRRYAGIDAVHVPISLLEPGDWPESGSFENEFVTLVNPCAVKGISIFLSLAAAFPETAFAAVPTWGANQQDRAALDAHPNVRMLEPVDDIDVLLRRTKVLLVPSLWAEARSRIVVEAMLRGVPVMASNVGGIPEAKMGVPYLLPVTPITKYQPRLDEQMVPVAEVPEQDVAPWREALGRLLTERSHYEEISRASREAALEYARGLSVELFEQLLEEAVVGRTPRSAADALVGLPRIQADVDGSAEGGSGGTRADQGVRPTTLSPDKRRLLALRLRKKAPSSAWFPGVDSVQGLRLFWFPHAGGGTALAGQVGDLPHVCPVRLPGRESRIAEAPFERMKPLVEALANAIQSYFRQPFAFFGHSMGAAVAFELCRLLRRRDQPLPKLLIASAARAPQYRRNYTPPPAPSDSQFLEELRRLEGIPRSVLDAPESMRAILPALKADAALYRDYVYAEDAPLPCPIRAYGGRDDPNVRLEHLEAWAEQTTASFGVRRFAGGHFYLQACWTELRAAIEEDLG
ncbi:MAG TPA: alpha/beta fold hydrolase [Bryobacteraceae bacterium]|nr:alpha/beta fold hydrolase [Bryobacteraceae bacterium]